ncbi:MAG: M28 family peptidase [Novosphingobium sp.]|uniref:M28 family metallopeptidase n=1 Tax=Novosphingobium sp. TaxID=1874826 RepID=UPI002634C3C2|nr:M28 family peptidase [Novosphingobium sp.]MCP5386679.1 M28 family peptidase [Novosphingobium sp.]
MKRLLRATKCLLAALAAGALLFAPAGAAPRRASKADKANAELSAQLLAHIVELSSDAYEGREPGTDGEARTLRYLGKQWFDIGLQSGTNDPGHPWFVPVTIVAREPEGSRLQFTRKSKRLFLPPEATLVLTSGKRSLVENAPLLFVGSGKAIPPRAELAGRVAVLLDGDDETSERQNALLKAGASAVLTVLDGDRSLENVSDRRRRLGYALAGEELGGDIEAFITAAGMDRMLAASNLSVAKLQALAAAPDFSRRVLELAATLEATTRETRIHTHNAIAKLPGRRPELGAVLLVAHWDHFGRCVPPPAEDQICNGAVDNASGLAVMTEVARRLAKGPPMDRDVYFLATTGEELGLLGAEAFAADPPMQLSSIVAAFNIDTVAIAPAGQPFGVVGKGLTALDPQIAVVAKAERRKLAEGDAANAYVKRQDGWALLQHDVPAVMISSSWGDIARVEQFMETDYHRPSDQVGPGLELGGAVDDVWFLTALTRWFADPKKVPAKAG